MIYLFSTTVCMYYRQYVVYNINGIVYSQTRLSFKNVLLYTLLCRTCNHTSHTRVYTLYSIYVQTGSFIFRHSHTRERNKLPGNKGTHLRIKPRHTQQELYSNKDAFVESHRNARTLTFHLITVVTNLQVTESPFTKRRIGYLVD